MTSGAITAVDIGFQPTYLIIADKQGGFHYMYEGGSTFTITTASGYSSKQINTMNNTGYQNSLYITSSGFEWNYNNQQSFDE